MVGIHHTYSETERKRILQQFANDVGGTFINREGWRDDLVRFGHGPTEITLDVVGEAAWKMEHHYTRLRAAFRNPRRVRLLVHRATTNDRVARLFGMQDIRVGHDAFDTSYIIQSNHPDVVQRLFSDAHLCQAVMNLQEVELCVRCTTREYDPSPPPGHDYLEMRLPGVIGDLQQLHEATRLFVMCHHALSHLASAAPTPT